MRAWGRDKEYIEGARYVMHRRSWESVVVRRHWVLHSKTRPRNKRGRVR